jgi:integrase/recombinase XerD
MFDNIPEIKEYFDTMAIDKSPKTMRVYSDAVNKMISYLHIENFQDVKKITAKNLRDHQKNMVDNGLSKSSVNTNMRPIRAMFNWLVENEYLNKSPMDNVRDMKAQKKEVCVLEDEEVDAMINACKNELDRLILILYFSTGLRREELCSLKLNSYNGKYIMPMRKGNEEQRLILQPKVCELLDAYLEKRLKKYPNTDALIVSKMGKAFTGTAIYMKVKSIARLAGFSDKRVNEIHVHTFRHNFSKSILDSGNSIYALKELLNHKNLNTTLIYSHLSSKAADKAMLNQREIG